ncbi:MAG: alpha/beta hydrolase [candidate division KSB1 bacterium]|nr:alpha/beta hydrolase [candidate division KSB1 bacterium]MDZ7367251.1 alpha/beta hydrolase [candidate division KSB1 bacterium]
MRSKLKWIVPLLIIAGLSILYLWPVPRVPFDALYAKVDPAIVNSLQSFRQANPPQRLQADGATWEYITAGEGQETILFLHGMTGAYDIWWQQIDALKGQYRIISVTYPPVRSLEELETGVLTILEKEGVRDFNVVGTSLGGYFAQYLITKHPDRVQRAVVATTFPPNDLIAEKNRTLGTILPYLPEWLVLSVFRGNFQQTIYPTSGNDELTLAFLNEMGYGRMSKAQLLGRYYCVIEKFTAPTPKIPVMIIESDNDPLVELTLREQLKATYPDATVHTFSGAGHFPYLNRAQGYTRLLVDFLSRP